MTLEGAFALSRAQRSTEPLEVAGEAMVLLTQPALDGLNGTSSGRQ
jgi:hypothetical protein